MLSSSVFGWQVEVAVFVIRMHALWRKAKSLPISASCLTLGYYSGAVCEHHPAPAHHGCSSYSTFVGTTSIRPRPCSTLLQPCRASLVLRYLKLAVATHEATVVCTTLGSSIEPLLTTVASSAHKVITEQRLFRR